MNKNKYRLANCVRVLKEINTINSLNARNILALLNPKRINFFRPKYQREYIWGRHNWELLFDDILNDEKEHFSGYNKNEEFDAANSFSLQKEDTPTQRLGCLN